MTIDADGHLTCWWQWIGIPNQTRRTGCGSTGQRWLPFPVPSTPYWAYPTVWPACQSSLSGKQRRPSLHRPPGSHRGTSAVNPLPSYEQYTSILGLESIVNSCRSTSFQLSKSPMTSEHCLYIGYSHTLWVYSPSRGTTSLDSTGRSSVPRTPDRLTRTHLENSCIRPYQLLVIDRPAA